MEGIEMIKNVSKTIILILILVGFPMTSALNAEALTPKLLWKKKLPFEIGSIKMAFQSGDVILSSKKGRQIILYDKQGNKRLQWGPRIDRQPMGIDISDDGDIIVYTTMWTENYAEKMKIDTNKLGWDERLHYVTRNGKELWNKQILGEAYLSPNGKMIAIGPSAGEGRDLIVMDLQGKVLWKYISRVVQHLTFSPDSNYLLFAGEEGLYLFEKNGNLLWIKKEDLMGSVTEGASYILTGKKVYDKQGNVVLDVSRDLPAEAIALESIDNEKIVIRYPDRISTIKRADMTVLKEFSLSRFSVLGGRGSSYDDRFMVFSGKTATSSNNLFIFDTLMNESWETRLEPNFYFILSKDGRYLLVVMMRLNKIVFYQVY
jgi:hypothetical protein